MILFRGGSVSYRYMRIFVFFDLPRYTSSENKEANNFRKRLLKDGFLMLQESVYCKLTLNQTAADYVKQRVKKYLPKSGSVMILQVTEKQFSSMDICCDKFYPDIIQNDSKLVII